MRCMLHTVSEVLLLLHVLHLASATRCPWGQFRVTTMPVCEPWLQCHQMADMPIGRLLGYGAVKKVYSSHWKGQPVALVFLNNEAYVDDFINGLNNLKALSVYPEVVQLVGFCEHSRVYATELHRFRDTSNYEVFLSSFVFHSIKDEMHFRLQFCMQYVRILNILHNFILGPMVMCDSNTLEKTVQQYLLSERQLLVLADTDALPIISRLGHPLQSLTTVCSANNHIICCCCNPARYMSCFHSYVQALVQPTCISDGQLCGTSGSSHASALQALRRSEGGVRCGSRPLFGHFIAPEQLTEEHTSTYPLLYDEATDVFKVPDVCWYFLGDQRNASIVMHKLKLIHEQCREMLPQSRPAAHEIHKFYSNISNTIHCQNTMQ